MSTVKKIWIGAALFVTIMIGFSVFIIQISGYNTVYKDEPTTKKPMKKMIMKCGAGKCGAAMIEEIDADTEAKLAKKAKK
ncbi:MAG: hypothetical protein QM497_11140 [Sulfurimonas sp.]